MTHRDHVLLEVLANVVIIPISVFVLHHFFGWYWVWMVALPTYLVYFYALKLWAYRARVKHDSEA